MTEAADPYDLERMVLGAVLTDPGTLPGVEAVLRPQDFAAAAHRRIYDAVGALAAGGRSVDLVTMRDELAARGELEEIGGASYLAGLLDGLPRLSNVEQWARLLRDHARRRHAREIGEYLATQATATEIETDELIDRAQGALLRLLEGGERQVVHARDVLGAAMRELEEFARSKTGVTGIPTGLTDLDRVTGGLKPGRLWVVAARFARGKSSFCAQVALEAARLGRKVLVIGMEMPPEEQMGRMLLTSAEVDRWALREDVRRDEQEHSYAWAMVAKAYGEIAELPLWFHRHEAPNIAQMRAVARSHAQANGLDLLIVDYIQRATLDPQLMRQGQWVAVGEVVKGLKTLARSLNVPVLAASQLNAHAEEKEPTLADFAQAQGAIGAETDVCLFLQPDKPKDFDREPMPAMRLMLKKHRGGACQSVDALYHKAITRFVNVSQETTAWRGDA